MPELDPRCDEITGLDRLSDEGWAEQEEQDRAEYEALRNPPAAPFRVGAYAP
jgi:hypothetical protein